MAVMEEFLALKHVMKTSMENLSNDVKNTCVRLENKIETSLEKIDSRIVKSDSSQPSQPCTTTLPPPPWTSPPTSI